MRSKDIAGLAGVTARTIRHYRQIGLLPEPHRDRNGYRVYAVSDLIRLLRIKSLAAAGVALADMPGFLESRGASADEYLDRLDRQLVDQIARLERQRKLVAGLRNSANAPGAGPGLDQPFQLLTDGRSEASNEAWREQLILFAQLLGPEDLARLNAIYERLALRSEEFLVLGKQYDALGPDSDEAEIADLARHYVDHFEDIFSEFREMLVTPEKDVIFKLMYAHTMSSANASQRKMSTILSSFMD